MEKNNRKNLPRYIVWVLATGLLGYNSVYIKKLSEVKAARHKDFDAVSFAGKIWEEKLPARLDSAVSLDQLLTALHSDPAQAFSHYSNALDIGNLRYSLVKAAGKVISVNEDDIDLRVNTRDSSVIVQLATEYVYGNAIRDASGLVDIKDFVNTMDLNNISAELDSRVRKDLLPAFRTTVKKGDSVSFAGALQLNKEHLRLDRLQVMPVALKILKD